MSGATSSIATWRGDPGQAADRPLAHRVVGMGEAGRVGRRVPEPDRDQRVGRVLLQRGLRQQLDQRALRPAAP